MKNKPTPFISSVTIMFFLMLLVLPSTLNLYAQIITPQKLTFSQICAGGPHPTIPGAVFNEYQAQFKISGFDSSVAFFVELSDPSGSFVNPTATTALPPLEGTPADTATDITLTFAVPTDLIGSNTYQLRVKSTTGVVSGSFTIGGPVATKSLPAYYKAFTDPFAINNNQSTAGYCVGGSMTLEVYNPTPQIANSSPANYPQLKYSWYKDDDLIPGQTSSSLVVNTNGFYYAKLDYGLCSDENYRSQSVEVSNSGGSTAAIASSSGNPFCSSSGKTTLTATAGNSYKWKKDNVVIEGAVSQTYQTDVAGVYTCDVDFGGCKSTGTIDLKVFKTDSSIEGVEVGEVNYISEGETINAVIKTDDAAGSSYEWFFNDDVIPGADKNSLSITSAGKYKGVITKSTGCVMSEEFPFEVTYKVNLNAPKISNIVTPNNDNVNDTWIIPDQYLAGTNTHILILSSLGEIVFETDNYDNFKGWPQTAIEFKNFNPVYYYIITPNGGSAKKGSITLVK